MKKTSTKNALSKQYQKLFSLDGIELEFEDEAYRAIAHLAIERKTGARGLRSIVEGIMLKPMYELPSDKTVEKVIVTAKYVNGEEPITIIRQKPCLSEAESDVNKEAKLLKA